MKPELLGEAKVAIATAKSTLPDLVWQGMAVKRNDVYVDFDGYKTWEVPKEYIEKSRNGFDPEHVATAIAYLRECCIPTKAPRSNSYWLKHLAEDWGAGHGMAPYIANGELIAAAIYLGLPVKVTDDNVNVRIGTKPPPQPWERGNRQGRRA